MMTLSPTPPKRFFAVCLTAAILLMAAAAPAGAAEPDDYRIVKKLVEEGARQTALSQAQAYLAEYPQGPHRAQVAGWAGRILVAESQAEKALPLLEEAVKGLPPKEIGDLPLDRAEALVALDRYADALQALKAFRAQTAGQAAREHRLAARAHSGLGEPQASLDALLTIPASARTFQDSVDTALAMAATGRDEAAVKALQPLLQNLPEGTPPELVAKARLALAGSDYRLKRYDQALAAVAPVLGQPPAPHPALLTAWILHAQGDDARAYDLVRQAAPLAGWEDAAALAPLRLALAERDWSAALDASAKVLKEKPSAAAAAEASLGRAQALVHEGDAAGAVELLEQALPKLQDDPRQYPLALEAGRLAWHDLHDPARAQRWLSLAAQAAGSDEDRARAALAMARFQWEKGSAGDALATVAGLVKAYPSTSAAPEAYLLLGRMRLAEGDRDQGQEALRVVMDSFPDAPTYPAEAGLELAKSYLTQGKADDARATLDEVDAATLGPEDQARRARLEAAIAMSQGRWSDASEALASAAGLQASAQAPSDASFDAALCQLMSGDVEGAVQAFGALPDPTLADAGRLRAASLLAASGKSDEARPLWLAVADDGGAGAPVALWSLAGDQLSRGDGDGGLATLKRLAGSADAGPFAVLAQRRLEMALITSDGPGAALMAIPLFREAEPVPLGEAQSALAQARAKAKAGDTAAAGKAYAAFLARFPQAPGAGEARLALARQAAARQDWSGVKGILDKDATGAPALYLYGQACFNLRDMAGAQAALEKALAAGLDPKEAPSAHFMAGTAARVQGKTGEAVPHLEAYAAAVSPAPEERDRLLSVALWLQRRGRLETALSALDKLRKVSRDAAVGFQYGYTLELMGRREDALKAYLQVAYTASNPQWALTARYRAAEIMAAMGRRDDAIALYKELVARSGESVQGDYAKRRLQELEAAKTGAAPSPAAPDNGGPDATSPAPH